MNSPRLPQSWTSTTLGEVCLIETGDKDVNEGHPEGHYPFFTCAREIHRSNTFSYDCEAILVAGNGFFNVKYYNGKFELYQRTYALRPVAIFGKFLYYLIEHKLDEITKDNRGSTIRYIRIGNLTHFSFPLPPLPEQRSIVAKIEELFSKLDAGVEALRKVKVEVKRYRQAVLKHAFEGKLTEEWRKRFRNADFGLRNEKIEATRIAAEPAAVYDVSGKSHSSSQSQIIGTQNDVQYEPASVLLGHIREERKNKLGKKFKESTPIDTSLLAELPEGWAWVRVGDITDQMQYGTSEKANKDSSGIPVLRMGNIQEGKLDFTELKYLPNEDIDSCLLKDGDVLFNRTNSAELVGKTAVFKANHPKAVFASYLIRLKVNRRVYHPDFISWFINSLHGRRYIASVVSQQVGQANVNGTKLSMMPVPFTFLQEQCEIVSEIDRRFSIADKLEKTIEQSMKQAERLRQSILKRAFEGKLVEQDPSDEPAEKLLQRIKAEKAQLRNINLAKRIKKTPKTVQSAMRGST